LHRGRIEPVGQLRDALAIAALDRVGAHFTGRERPASVHRGIRVAGLDQAARRYRGVVHVAGRIPERLRALTLARPGWARQNVAMPANEKRRCKASSGLARLLTTNVADMCWPPARRPLDVPSITDARCIDRKTCSGLVLRRRPRTAIPAEARARQPHLASFMCAPLCAVHRPRVPAKSIRCWCYLHR
jgi:hypothetical protein